MSIPDTARHAANTLVFESYLCLEYNYRMTDIQATIGIEQLKWLGWIVASRQRPAGLYNRAFADFLGLLVPSPPAGVEPNYQSYAIRLTDGAGIFRDELIRRLLERGISSRCGVMTIDREPAYADSCASLRLPIS